MHQVCDGKQWITMPVEEMDTQEAPLRVRPAADAMLSWMRYSPFRQPDAHWRQAEWILRTGGRFSRQRDGDALRPVLAYRRRLEHATPRQLARLKRDAPALSRAHALYEQDGPTTWEIRARLLAGESMEVIADKTGETVATLVTFESAFFTVTDRLQAHDWLLTQALRVGDWETGRPTEAQVWMCNGLYFGPHAVDVLVAAHHGRDTVPDADRDHLLQRMHLAARSLCTPGGDPDYMQDLLDALPDPSILGPMLPLIRFLIRDGRRHGRAIQTRQEAATPREQIRESIHRN